jgi:hypothetical protein
MPVDEKPRRSADMPISWVARPRWEAGRKEAAYVGKFVINTSL